MGKMTVHRGQTYNWTVSSWRVFETWERTSRQTTLRLRVVRLGEEPMSVAQPAAGDPEAVDN
jgi:hypothetical protein